jgi:hypothetical protein
MNDVSKYFLRIAEQTNRTQAELAKLCGTGGIKKKASGSLAANVQDVLLLLEAFPDCVGYAKNRRGVEILDLSDEARLQDLIYFMLRPAIGDLVPEKPVSGAVRQFSIEDYLSKQLKVVVEAKIIRNKSHGRSVRSELNDDIGNYKDDEDCHHLIFFIYDPAKHIESPSGLAKTVQGTHIHQGKPLNVYCLIHH